MFLEFDYVANLIGILLFVYNMMKIVIELKECVLKKSFILLLVLSLLKFDAWDDIVKTGKVYSFPAAVGFLLVQFLIFYPVFL